MGLARRPLARTPNIGFHKLLGTGGGHGFYPSPNFHVYGILACWPDIATAQERLDGADVFRRYGDRSSERCDLFLRPSRTRGAWDGAPRFEPDPEWSEPEGGPKPLAVLTRGSVKLRHVPAFWRHAPAIDEDISRAPGMLFKIGMGEAPYIRQVTFSIWRSEADMRSFAYAGDHHRNAAKAAFRNHWFSEDLFARFSVLRVDGAWEGGAPLKRHAA